MYLIGSKVLDNDDNDGDNEDTTIWISDWYLLKVPVYSFLFSLSFVEALFIKYSLGSWRIVVISKYFKVNKTVFIEISSIANFPRHDIWINLPQLVCNFSHNFVAHRRGNLQIAKTNWTRRCLVQHSLNWTKHSISY